MKFKVYNHTKNLPDGKLLRRSFIVLEIEKNHYQFTNFHKYIDRSKSDIRSIFSDANNKYYYITNFLNYIYFY